MVVCKGPEEMYRPDPDATDEPEGPGRLAFSVDGGPVKAVGWGAVNECTNREVGVKGPEGAA